MGCRAAGMHRWVGAGSTGTCLYSMQPIAVGAGWHSARGGAKQEGLRLGGIPCCSGGAQLCADRHSHGTWSIARGERVTCNDHNKNKEDRQRSPRRTGQHD